MAAVMATMRGFSAAISISVRPKMSVYDGALPEDGSVRPVSTSNGAMPSYFGEFIAAAFLRDEVNQNRAFQFFYIFKIFNEIVQAMAFQRPNVRKPELLKKRTGNDEGFQRFFDLLGKL